MIRESNETPVIQVPKHVAICVDGAIVDASVLAALVDTNARVLWRFVERDGRVVAIPYTERKVIWLEDSDLSYAAEIKAGKLG